MADDAARRSLFAYLTATNAREYIAILDLFTGSVMSDLGAADIAARLAGTDHSLPVESVEERCVALVQWGTLITSLRDARVATVAEYLRARSRYQLSPLGGRVHREAKEVLAAAEGAREVARELLGTIVEQLNRLIALVGSTAPEADTIAGEVTSIFASQRLFNESVTDFYAYLSGVLSRYDLVGDEFAHFKKVLLTYVDVITADVNRHAPAIIARLHTLLPRLDDVLRALDSLAGLGALDGTAVDRGRGRVRADWDDLLQWYGDGPSRSGPDQLRSAAGQALAQLLSNAKRQLAEQTTGVSRRDDLLRLAGWFAETSGDNAHRLFAAAFGLYPSRHLLLGPEDVDPRITPNRSWWDDLPVVVPVSVRERGDRAARGRTARVPDPSKDRAYLLARAAADETRRRAAAAELVAAGTLHGARLSTAARELLLDELALAFTQSDDPTALVQHVESDLGLTLTVEPGPSTEIDGDDGRLVIDGLRVRVIATAAMALEESG
jgi:uncharacterized protein (TIGR02677 family)